MAASARKELQEMMVKKDEMEAEIKELQDVLESQKGVGMHGSLVDEEEFPRADIDIYTVRQARHRIVCLQNDHKTLMKEIEDSLHKLHALSREENEKTQSNVEEATATSSDTAPLQPFAKVDKVDPGSPAADSGLQVHDLITKFGSITSSNFTSLQNIATVVQHSVGKPVSITVLREGEEVHIGLIPQSWSGRGLLGCNILPIKGT